MPPPNITGQLHLGHALFVTLQDITTRFRRMQGYAALWLPGTDHAGLATQTKLDTTMLQQGLDPNGPEFDSFALTYKQNLKNTISDQLRACGASCDWSRERFTLDDAYSASVIEALKRCHSAQMLYSHEGQWYLNMEPLAASILTSMEMGDITIIPAGEAGTMRNFLSNIEPWCISRQIRWGHRLPIWTNDGQIEIAEKSPGDNWIQEEGCLDTWFSSALWPFATLGWPDNTEDFQQFYPAAMIETADDILFFWCARMLMMGILLTGRLPFDTIFLHGLIRDKFGKKMSKSDGNGIDPLDIIKKYGCDAMRFALAENAVAGHDMKLSEECFQSAKALRIKLWNAARYTIGHNDRIGYEDRSSDHADDIKMKNILSDAHTKITKELEDFRYHIAAADIRKLLYNDFCGWYIEATKERLYQQDDKNALATLMFCLEGILHLIHPFMPFVSERIRMSYSDVQLITDDWDQ